VIRALVFDFDGLIADTEGPIYQAWAEIYLEQGQELDPGRWSEVVGHSDIPFDPVGELEGLTGRTLDRETVMDAGRRRGRELALVQPTLPGVREWRDEARRRGMSLGVASSSSRAWVTGHLERLQLDGWDCIRCRDDVAHAKPAPDLYLAAVDCLGVAPGEALAIEDSGPGVAAAKAAGLHCVAVPSWLTAGHDLSPADLIVSSLAESSLGSVLESII
jgi:beta-phosphoglucomutase-like phosphatase (HAD superfamily)